MAARFLDEEARAAFARAIRTIESVSAVEVVVAMRRRSHGYRHANVAIACAAAFAGLAAMLFAQHSFSLASILVDPFVVGLIAGGLVELLPGVKRVLTPPAHRRRHVRRAARATFVERSVHATAARSGLLVYISWLEQDIALVPDVGLAAALPGETFGRIEQELGAAMRGGGTHVARALEKLSAELATAMPVGPDDRNELSDAIDSDLERA